MYATASEYLGYKVPKSSVQRKPVTANSAYYKPVENFESPKIGTKVEEKTQITELKYKTSITSTSDPKVWGPSFWFTLHVSAAHYPENPSQIVRERMKHRILAIPYEVPCATCRPHASAFIESYRDKLDQIVSNKHELGKFYVDFHNKVNKRYGKPEWTYEQAYKVYSGQAKVTYLTN
jgi:hypothetical protein